MNDDPKASIRRWLGLEVDDRQFPLESGEEFACLREESEVDQQLFRQILDISDGELQEGLRNMPNLELARALIGIPEPVALKICENLSDAGGDLLVEDVERLANEGVYDSGGGVQPVDNSQEAIDGSRRVFFEVLCRSQLLRHRN